MAIFLNKRLWIATAIFAATPGYASVAINGSGRLSLRVAASVGAERSATYESVIDEDDTGSVSNPASLTAAVSAKVTYGSLLSSVAVDARADFLSPDHGTFDLNSLELLSQPDTSPFEPEPDGSWYQQSDTPFTYSFTSSVDAILTMSLTGSTFSTGTSPFREMWSYIIGGAFSGSSEAYYVYTSTDTYSRSYNLAAGTHYTFSFGAGIGSGRTDHARDYTKLGTNHFEFDIVAAPPAPPSASVPEPGIWAMLIVGLGMIGRNLRRSGRPALA